MALWVANQQQWLEKKGPPPSAASAISRPCPGELFNEFCMESAGQEMSKKKNPMNTVVVIFRGASKFYERDRFGPGTSGVTHPVGSLAPLHPTASLSAGEPGWQLADVNHLGEKVLYVKS